MKKLQRFIIILATLIVNTSCGVLLWVDNPCREFALDGEEYWFPQSLGDTVTFVNNESEKMEFVITGKVSSHVTKYITDTGCSCRDYSNMEMVCGLDTIYLQRLSKYIYDDAAVTALHVVFMFDNLEHSIFFNEDMKEDEDLQIDSVQIRDCRVYEQNYKEGRRINKVFLAKGMGIMRYIMQDGTIWTNEDLTKHEENQLNSFDYEEFECD